MNTSVVLGGILLLLLWGAYGIAGKFAVREIGLQVLLWSPVVWVLMLPACFLIFKELWPPRFDNFAGIGWAIGAGLLGVSGTIVFYWLLRGAPTNVVVPISALYPVVTVVLAFFILHEALTPMRIAGIALAVVAIWLLSS